jgi:hypothetical protein
MINREDDQTKQSIQPEGSDGGRGEPTVPSAGSNHREGELDPVSAYTEMKSAQPTKKKTDTQNAVEAISEGPLDHVLEAGDAAEGLTVASSLNGKTIRQLLRNRNFVPLWIGQMVSYLGDQFMLVAALAVVSKLAPQNSGIVAAGLGLSNALP